MRSRRRGATSVEYGVIVASLLLLLLVAVYSLSGAVSAMYAKIGAMPL